MFKHFPVSFYPFLHLFFSVRLFLCLSVHLFSSTINRPAKIKETARKRSLLFYIEYKPD
jgi:hypothetical protein